MMNNERKMIEILLVVGLAILLPTVAGAQQAEKPQAEQVKEGELPPDQQAPKDQAPKDQAPKDQAPKDQAPKEEVVPGQQPPEEQKQPDVTMPPAVTEAQVTTTMTTERAAPRVLLGLNVGVYIPTSDLGLNAVVALDATYQLAVLRGRLGVGFGMAYSQPTASGTIEDSRVPGGKADYDSIMRELTLDLRVSYRFLDWSSVWSPHVAIGPIMYLLSHEVDSLQHKQTETSTQGGFVAVIGADYYLKKGALVGEVRIPFATVSQKTTGDSNVGAVAVTVGYRFRF